MNFETKIDYDISESDDLQSAQNKAVTIYNWIKDLTSKEQNPTDCGTDICDIIDMINDLHSKVPELMNIMNRADNYARHLRAFKND